MDSRLKQRLIGAVVLVALAVIFLPMLVQGPAPDSGVSDVPLTMPAPPRNDYETRDLPLVAPADAPSGGAVGMAAAPAAIAPTASPPSPAAATPLPDAPVAASSPPLAKPPVSDATPAPGEPLPATVAGGDYAVSVGSYSSQAAADAVVASLRASQLPASRDQTTANGKSLWRVRVGPYASQASAQAARLRAATVHGAAGARVIALDAPVKPVDASQATASAPATASKPPAPAAATSPTASPPIATTPPTAVTPAAASVGFAVQLAAFSKAADATALRDKLQAAGFSAFTESVNTDHGALTRVRAGPVQTRAQADQLLAQIKRKLGLDGVVRPHP